MIPRSISRRPLRAVAFAAIVLLLVYSFSDVSFSDFGGRGYHKWRWQSSEGVSPFNETCKSSRASVARDVQVIVKTGGSEPLGRLTTQIATLLTEVPMQNLLIFSDLDEDVGFYHVQDVLKDIPKEERSVYPAFALYDQQQVLKAEGKDTRELNGWELDRYKNLPMKRMIWNLQQSLKKEERKKWFLFIDTDTWVEWDNIFELLGHLDSSDKLYMGSPVWRKPLLEFAHGGSAYVFSYGALEALNKPDSHTIGTPLYSQYGVNVTEICCGDLAVALALNDRGIGMKGYWPMFNGEIAATTPYGDDHWCEPVISFHHIGESELDDFWRWHKDWKAKTKGLQPLLYKDVYEYVADGFMEKREDWNNIEEVTRRLDAATFEDCKDACEVDRFCYQFTHHGDKCDLAHYFRVGRVRPAEVGKDKFVAGWHLGRIQAFMARKKCKTAHWVKSNP
ncbi:glycosyltransferase family 31 protein [Leptodontidium sp. MPI-SDFR-AT-0119]|nr:glycosyltransferase family 31 protein [Leptodontidium sp. MPI-SDFR-AT-0119]